MTYVTVLDDIFADHAALPTHVLVPHDTCWQHSWRMPSVLPWTDVDGHSLDFHDQQPFVWTPLDVTSSFQTWSHAAEQ